MTVGQRFGANLTRCRKRAGLSQEQLGVRAGLHRTEIGLLERGQRVPRIDTLIKLATSLPADVHDLLDGISWKPGEPRAGLFELAEED
ncbi:MAG: helix-turn-helix transcriptional regulator [Solirubrobacterales bacterium]